MSMYRYGTINTTTALLSTGVNLMLGFIPDVFKIYNLTNIQSSATPTGVTEVTWLKGMPSPSASILTYTSGVGALSYITTNGISQVILGADWQNTIYTITNISNANPGVVTVTTISPTNSMTLVNGMTVTISGVNGMTGLNTNRYIVSNLTAASGIEYTFTLYDTFGNPVDTTGLGTYTSGGELDVISYPPTAPILNSVNGQVITPGYPAGLQYDIGYEGLTLGSAVLGANGNVLKWSAIYQNPAGW